MLVYSISDDAFGLEMHRSHLNVNLSQIAVPHASNPRFGKQLVETFDDPLAFKFSLEEEGLPNILINAHKSKAFSCLKVLDDSENHRQRQAQFELLKFVLFFIFVPLKQFHDFLYSFCFRF